MRPMVAPLRRCAVTGAWSAARAEASLLALYAVGGPYAPDRLPPAATDDAPARSRPPTIPPQLWARMSWHSRARFLARYPRPPDPPWRTAALQLLAQMPPHGHLRHPEPKD